MSIVYLRDDPFNKLKWVEKSKAPLPNPRDPSPLKMSNSVFIVLLT